MQALLEAGASVAVKDQAGLTPAWYAIMCYISLPEVEKEDAKTKKQLFDLIITLIKKDTDLGVLNNEGMSLLYYAVLHGAHDIAGQLLQHGAQGDMACNGGTTPFEVLLQQCLSCVQPIFSSAKEYHQGLYTKFERCYAMIPIFLIYDIDLDHEDQDRRTALFHVVMAYISLPKADSEYRENAKKCLYDLIALFITKGVFVDVCDEKNNTLLLLALKKRAIDVAVLLRGTEKNPSDDISIHAICAINITPLTYVVDTGDIDLIALMTLKMNYDDYRAKHDNHKNAVPHLSKRNGRRGSLRMPRRKLSGLLDEKKVPQPEEGAHKKGTKKKGFHLDRVRKQRSYSMSNITFRGKPSRGSYESETDDSSVLERLREKMTLRKLRRSARKSILSDDETDDEAVDDSYHESVDDREDQAPSSEGSVNDPEIEASWQEIFSSLAGSEVENSKSEGSEDLAQKIFQAINDADVETLGTLVTDEAALYITNEAGLSVLMYAVNHILNEVSFLDDEKRLAVVASLCRIAMNDLSDQEEESSSSNGKAIVLQCALINALLSRKHGIWCRRIHIRKESSICALMNAMSSYE